MNLREQFLKSGLITKKQAQKQESTQNKQNFVLSKDKLLLKAADFEKQKQNSEIARAFEMQKEIDRDLNKQRELLLLQRAEMYRIRQLINSNVQNKRAANEVYFFAENKFVRKIYVTAWQREMLARGALGVVRPDENIDDFIILPREIIKTLLDICANKVIVLYSEIENLNELGINSENIESTKKEIEYEQSSSTNA